MLFLRGIPTSYEVSHLSLIFLTILTLSDSFLQGLFSTTFSQTALSHIYSKVTDQVLYPYQTTHSIIAHYLATNNSNIFCCASQITTSLSAWVIFRGENVSGSLLKQSSVMGLWYSLLCLTYLRRPLDINHSKQSRIFCLRVSAPRGNIFVHVMSYHSYAFSQITLSRCPDYRLWYRATQHWEKNSSIVP